MEAFGRDLRNNSTLRHENIEIITMRGIMSEAVSTQIENDSRSVKKSVEWTQNITIKCR
jgi:hypothetical protein